MARRGLSQNFSPPRRHRVLVTSLLVQNPTAVGRNEATAEPAASGATTRARSRRLAAAAAALPEEILVYEIFVRLPGKDILRCRAVCRSWHGLTSASDFLVAHHRRQPSFHLLRLFGADSAKDGLPIFDHSRLLLGVDSYIDFQLFASCDGLLLFSLFDCQFIICNPTTRESAPLPCLTTVGRINIAALYLHCPSGEYRLLYLTGTHRDQLNKAAYNILKVCRAKSPRCIGVPSDTPGIEDVMWACHQADATPPVFFRNSLHWDSDMDVSDAGILVFDTLVESFRLMCRPAAATRFCNRLCDMEGSIGFSCNNEYHGTAFKIWVLEDYEREVWSFKYHVKFPVDRSYYPAQHLVLSHKGDVLIYTPHHGYMLHCDNTGKLLEEFRSGSRGLTIIGHRFKESLVKHHISLRRGSARVFQRV